MVWPSRLVLGKKFFWIWFIYTLEGCVLVLHFFILTKCHLWNTLMSPHDMSRHGEQKSSWLFWYYSLSNSNLLYSVNKKTLDQVGFCCSVVYLFSTRRKWKWGPRSWNFWYSVFLYSVFVLWSSEATEESDLVLIMSGHLEKSYNCMYRSHGYYP